MTGQDLKNSILQLAIQGKLVAQDANDEPASVLLERIKAEKKKLIEEKKIKKEKPLAEITEDEKPFEIPDSWVWVRLGDLCSHVVDCPHSTPIKSNTITQYPCIRTSEIKGGSIVWNSMQYLDERNYQLRIARLKPMPGDIVYAREGVYGDAVILPIGYEFCLGQRTMLMRMALAESVNYIHKAIISPYVYSQAKALNREGTTNVGHVNMSDIVTFVIPLPPLSEQKRIVAKIEELMPLVDEYDKAQKELNALNSAMPEQLKQSILQEAIMGKLGTNNPDDEPASELLKRIRKEKEQLIKDKKIKKEKPLPEITDEEKPFDIPDNWVWCRLGEISCFNGGFAFKSCNYVDKGNGIRVLRISDFSESGISNKSAVYYPYDKSLDKYVLEENDIVMCMTGGTVGKSYHVKKLEEQFYVNQRVADIKTQIVDSDYIYIVISSQYIQQIICESKNSTNDNISASLINEFIIPLPPLAEQHRIVSKIENLFACIEPLAKDL